MSCKFVRALAVAAALLFAGAAQAETTVIARAGVWQAFAGTANDGTKLCGISTTWPDERYFGLKFYKGDKTFTIQMGSPKWKIDDGAKQTVAMQIDANGTWKGTATGMHFGDKTAGLEFEIVEAQLSQFVEEFAHGETLYLSFPNANVDDWQASLDGTPTLIRTFISCIEAM
ncbi:MAG TPA: hypothetical protein VFA12_10550 [Stellaceae bacterium]|nr:hypothetical protein [Stellaceae bacterium]